MKVITLNTGILKEDKWSYEAFLKNVYTLTEFSLIMPYDSFYLKIQFYDDLEKTLYDRMSPEFSFLLKKRKGRLAF